MVDTEIDAARGMLTAVSNAMVALHKEQFERAATRARSNFAGNDVLACVLEDMLLPAERTTVAIGHQQRACATPACTCRWPPRSSSPRLSRASCSKVHAFASAADRDHDTVFEIFAFEPAPATDGDAS